MDMAKTQNHDDNDGGDEEDGLDGEETALGTDDGKEYLVSSGSTRNKKRNKRKRSSTRRRPSWQQKNGVCLFQKTIKLFKTISFLVSYFMF